MKPKTTNDNFEESFDKIKNYYRKRNHFKKRKDNQNKIKPRGRK